MHRLFSLLMFILIAIANSFAQSPLLKVEYQAIDKQTDLPIPFVTIVWTGEGTNQSLISDSLGKFSLDLDPARVPTITAKHVAYVDYQIFMISKAPLKFYMDQTTEYMESAIITAIRSSKNNPVTVTNIDKIEIESKNFGQDLPMMLNQTPSTVVSSDAGAGVGYTGIRIRGIDPTRINVTINGIPLNDAEAHGIYWVNLPDFASSANSIQIQRGVGTSTNGSGAFGSSINVKTDHVESKAFASADLGLGSFNTKRMNAQFGTGVLQSGWGLQGRFSAIQSDGFIDRASSDLKSMFLTAAHYGKTDLLKFNFMAGHERTYQAWYGVPQPKFNGDTAATRTFMNELYLSDTEQKHLLESNDQTYNPYTYKNEVDNYDQHHLQLFYNKRFRNTLRLNTGLHYTHGFGYYEQYRAGDDFSDYNLPNIYLGNDSITSGDFIRRKWLNNHFFGGIASLEINRGNSNLIVGGGFHQYLGQHFGDLIWAQYASTSTYESKYYDNKASKSDGNLYAKYSHQHNAKLSSYVDVQARKVDYTYFNPNDNQDHTVNYLFFNPKAGFVYAWQKHQLLNFFVGMSNREPVRTDFVESKTGAAPSPERLYNVELGNTWQNKKMAFKANYFMMYYTNQLVLSGELNDVGAYIRTNVDKSYRTGLELEGAWEPLKKLKIESNTTFSRNKIVAFTEFVDDWNNGRQVQIEQKNTSLAFSPEFVGMLAVNYAYNDAWSSQLNVKSVGSQYLDNSESNDRKLDGFTVAGLQVGKNWNSKSGYNIQLGLQINNLFDLKYAPNGYTFGTFDSGVRKSYNYVYPMAGRHFMLRLKVGI